MASTPPNTNLFAAIDMGTNSFKLLVIRADPTTGRFLTVDRLKHPLIHPLSAATTAASLRQFKQIIDSKHIPPSNYRIVATSAVRESPDQALLLNHLHQTLGLQVQVLTGQEEALLIYRGIRQFYPVNSKSVLVIDIGGGSTEFVIAESDCVHFSTSLKLGHVTLSQRFGSVDDVASLRDYVRGVVRESGLVEVVKRYGFDVVIGSSGTIKAIEKAVFCRYGSEVSDVFAEFDEFRREWRFSKEELRGVVGSLLGGEVEGVRDVFFKRRSGFIVAGAVLLEEIFGLLGIEEMEVSGYALGEGVVAEMLAEVFEGYDLNANVRWRSVMQLATRFNNKERMKCAALCAAIAKEIFEGLKKLTEVGDASLNDKDLEYLEAACLLHTIGQFTGKKGYHKRSYQIIMNGGQLHGYNTEEIKLIALLSRHHRKKFPKRGHNSLEGFTNEAAEKFRVLCIILRLSALITQSMPINVEDIELSHCHDGLKLEIKNQSLQSADMIDAKVQTKKELEHFKVVLKQKLTVEVCTNTSEPFG
ncbi:hypothetical protein DCAR_0625267 [Daucus carota subsp. sativus]|uniref:Uncharacterized protein n=1 Tax=Daucus carota subsp. sativus TaxID=79200 RepID=A0A164WBS1_DAUCS|nr:PREDICTED: exopolyphosphatase-like isoform X1 [Daucus carota subsp. sativus]XP_017258462.1 PREDICTED: exopolyphosphatase-like isoform X1 [Daucus carota subsp. sativus]XP_017258463.1 PREDICTED: exopolyphosphatase-like isoform X1 [Daucus carota subsp. sativus]XP_017258464.1 PREDICTED: exopolyphosphatase-like isoform X1 [Daucus carota subsp. sativus]XP_017258465.1 PREDICTED: exopolyphosphatase-like isoform X1 [Daucus carota subsp. sativus]XP_017258466.1 PREDICTED: exopolyphosphatase-like isofo